MSISSSGTRKSGPYSGNGSTTAFPFTFKVFQASDVRVVQTDTTPTDYTLALNTDYTVALNANQDVNPGGTVNMAAAPPAGYLLTIGSNVPELQSVTLTNNGGFYPTVINSALDYLTILIQQLSEKIGRALTLPFSTSGTVSTQLPPVAPGSLLGWKADGSGIANVGASGVGAGGIVASNLAPGATGSALSADTQASAAKAVPADADEIPLFDSANFWYLKNLTWANLKAVLYTYIVSLLNMTGAINYARTPVASAAAPDIWTGTGNHINYTGTATATGFSAAPQAGASRLLDCAAAASFTAGPNMLIDGVPSGQTLTVAPGDRIEVIARSTTQFVLKWFQAAGQGSRLQSLTASVAANALTVGLNPTTLDFRSATPGSGIPATLSNPAALSLTIPSGATLGTISGQQARLILLALDNAGTMELAIVNRAGGLNLDETALINTTAISAASNSNNVIYAANARTAVPFRVVGYVDVTEATAGTWATAPANIQGAGGPALGALGSLGYGQTWQDVKASRASGVTYYNTTGKPIAVAVSSGSGTACAVTFYVNAVGILNSVYNGSGGGVASGMLIVPANAAYSVSVTGGIGYWAELR